MRKTALALAITGTAFVVLFSPAPAQAQTRTWVSGVGDDLNPCSRTAPCKTFAGAISKTSAGGEINCLDSGGFGSVSITKSITIKCEGVIGGVLASGTFGVNVNDSASATPGTAIVTISGLDIEGFGTGTNGIQFISGGVLHVHKTQIRNFRQSGAGGNGISITHSSNTGTPKKVLVMDSYITDNGSNNQNAGILVRPTAGAQVNVVVANTKMESNRNGIFLDGAGGAGGSNVNVTHSVLSGGFDNGVSVFSTGASLRATVADSLISSNAGAGVTAAGAGASIKIGSDTITHNVTGVSGSVQSFKNNQIVDNGADGTPVTAVSSGGGILN